MSGLTVLAITTTLAVYVLIVIGGYVSSTGSGLACPDWPLCYGNVFPEFTFPVLLEFTHRVWSMVVAVLIVSLMVLSLREWRKSGSALIGITSTLSFGLLVVQVFMGMLVVQSGLQPLLRTTHLGLATAVFGMVLTTALIAHRLPKQKVGV